MLDSHVVLSQPAYSILRHKRIDISNFELEYLCKIETKCEITIFKCFYQSVGLICDEICDKEGRICCKQNIFKDINLL